ncbi:thioredoxin family protein [Alkalihalobacillus sp. 1P02AB]|uniref:thioredoxin family protein n=1 Tax=Alkalihalobacillus sp. 1P02AB TaxID=3132260 RepID=UPI0039A63359
MKEISIERFEQKLHQRDSVEFLYVYTPLCGTCKLASKMIEIVEATNEQMTINQLNINHAAHFAQKWKIESVPCLLVFQNGLGVERLYAFQSVAYLFDTLKPYFVKKQLELNLKEQ